MLLMIDHKHGNPAASDAIRYPQKLGIYHT